MQISFYILLNQIVWKRKGDWGDEGKKRILRDVNTQNLLCRLIMLISAIGAEPEILIEYFSKRLLVRNVVNICLNGSCVKLGWLNTQFLNSFWMEVIFKTLSKFCYNGNINFSQILRCHYVIKVVKFFPVYLFACLILINGFI